MGPSPDVLHKNLGFNQIPQAAHVTRAPFTFTWALGFPGVSLYICVYIFNLPNPGIKPAPLLQAYSLPLSQRGSSGGQLQKPLAQAFHLLRLVHSHAPALSPMWTSPAAGRLISQVIPPAVKNMPATQDLQEMQVGPLGREDPLEKAMATNSSILAWRIPCTEAPGGLQFIGLQRVGHD